MQFAQSQYVPSANTLELYVSGCHQHCPGCHNPELWDPKYGNQMTVDEIVSKHVRPYINAPVKQIHILGGEPLEQPHEELFELCGVSGALLGAPVIVFTGETLLNRTHGHEFFFTSHDGSYGHEFTIYGGCVSYFKCGCYRSELPKAEINKLGFELASNNQFLVPVEYGVE